MVWYILSHGMVYFIAWYGIFYRMVWYILSHGMVLHHLVCNMMLWTGIYAAWYCMIWCMVSYDVCYIMICHGVWYCVG